MSKIKKRSAALDIETNGLLQDLIDFSSLPYKLLPKARLWVVVVRDIDTGESWSAENEKITPEWLEKTLKPFYFIIAHNGIKYDFPLLKLFKILNYKIGWLTEDDTCFGKKCKFLDSLILSRLASPDRFGGHSLKAWGLRVKEPKDDYRFQCISKGYVEEGTPKGEEFKKWNPLMLDYCKQDCKTNGKVFKKITQEFAGYNWNNSIKQEHILADLGIKRELFGFNFDKEKAVECVEELNGFLKNLADKVEPLLPPKPLNQTELNFWTPPKKQLNKDNSLSKSMANFLARIKSTVKGETFEYEGKTYSIPHYEPLKTETNAEMKDFDHIKMFLIDKYGWLPTEWSNRDLTKDSKKIPISLEKQTAALDRWWKDTEGGKYTKGRTRELDMPLSLVYENLLNKLGSKFPVRVPTSPKIRVGVEKELCPNLIKLGDKVEFAKDFASWLTYRHRRNSIAGGDISMINLYQEKPTSGFLSCVRDVDGRIPTPAIEIGTVTSRYTHISVANIPRPSSTYGGEMRSLFGCGDGYVQLGYDFSSLENRIQGSYIYKYKGGPWMAEALVAEKPYDLHTKNSEMLGITRTDAKSFTYAVLYGASPKKVKKMLGVSLEKAKQLVDDFWSGNPSLNSLKHDLEDSWYNVDKKYIVGLDGRKVPTRSKHSLLNALFQSGGVIITKYTLILAFEKFEKMGYCIDPFEGKPDIIEMIAYHDESQLAVNPKLLSFKTFKTEQKAKKFVNNWKGEQLSNIREGKNDKYFVCLPNNISKALNNSIKEASQMFKVPVDLGIEWVVGSTWEDCH